MFFLLEWKAYGGGPFAVVFFLIKKTFVVVRCCVKKRPEYGVYLQWVVLPVLAEVGSQVDVYGIRMQLGWSI